MSDLNNEIAAPPAGNEAPNTNDNTVTLSREEYAKMTSDMATMKTYLEMVANQQEGPAPTPPGNLDIDQMTNTQLLDLIQNQMAQPILQAVMTLSVKDELRELKSEFTDFDEYKKQVYDIASKNTTLSLRDSYLMAKASTKGFATPPPPPTPKDPPPPPAPGQRPTVPTSVAVPSTKMTAREAAAKALKELNIT